MRVLGPALLEVLIPAAAAAARAVAAVATAAGVVDGALEHLGRSATELAGDAVSHSVEAFFDC